MSVLADFQIEALTGAIVPYLPEQRRIDNGPSGGPSSYGYDLTLADEFKRMEPGVVPVDTRRLHGVRWQHFKADVLRLEPGEAVLGRSIETVTVPRNTIVLCFNKSTLARCFIDVKVTPLEPGWTGEVTIELVNQACRPVLLHPGDGICQIVFFQGVMPRVTYDMRGGRYQGQRGVVAPT